jgi:RNA polymerase sigma factor (sigma-70 family)
VRDRGAATHVKGQKCLHQPYRCDNQYNCGLSAPTNVVSISSGGHRTRVLKRRDRLVLDHLKMAEGIARLVALKLPPSFELDDLIGVANVALIMAATRYRPGAHGGTPFSAYARLVVRGAILDSVRGPKYVENTRPGIDGMDAVAPRDARTGNDSAVDREREDRRLVEAVSALPALQRRVLTAVYTPAELTRAEVGARLHLSRAQVDYQHDLGVRALKTRLKRPA